MAMWDGIVGNAAKALAHPDLTSAVRSLHPGVMPKASKGIEGYADGGAVDTGDGTMPGPNDLSAGGLDMNDPRMAVIGDAEDAIGHAQSGQPLQPHHIAAFKKFHQTFGQHAPAALEQLHQHVGQGMRMRPGRMVTGPAGDDKVPAVVDGVKHAKLTTGEFVMPVDAVHGAGQGDPVLGAQRLQQLSTQLSAMKPAGATKAVDPAMLSAAPGVNIENVKQ